MEISGGVGLSPLALFCWKIIESKKGAQTNCLPVAQSLTQVWNYRNYHYENAPFKMEPF